MCCLALVAGAYVVGKWLQDNFLNVPDDINYDENNLEWSNQLLKNQCFYNCSLRVPSMQITRVAACHCKSRRLRVTLRQQWHQLCVTLETAMPVMTTSCRSPLTVSSSHVFTEACQQQIPRSKVRTMYTMSGLSLHSNSWSFLHSGDTNSLWQIVEIGSDS